MRYIICILFLFPYPAFAETPVWGCTGSLDENGTPICGPGHWRTYCEIYLVSGTCGPVFELLRPAVSNVLFLPGIKGSRLYADGGRLWQPGGSEDVRNLFLTEVGESVNPLVYAQAGDLLSDIFASDFYTAFFNDLEEAEANNTFGTNWTWEAGAYDWRLSLTDIVTKGARYEDRIYYAETNGMPYLERLLRDLADTSETGKVTIVAHSNGGLVAKALMQALGTEAETLVDDLIFVGVPQSGAPRAIAGALFGYGEALPIDSCADQSRLCALMVDRETARTFAEHSPMTYHLLPSLPFFSHYAPPVTWSGSEHFAEERLAYGTSIDTRTELHDYLLAREGGRTKPAPEDTGSANVLSEELLAYANTIHTSLDMWMPPEGVEVHQIGGVGHETFSGISFYEEPRLFGSSIPRYRPTFTSHGDGIVPGVSAVMMTGESVHTYWLDLYEHDYSHADLLENEGIRTLIANILTGKSELPSGISEIQPVPSTKMRLLFILHSPLTLGITDVDGLYTGLTKDGAVLQKRTDIEYGTFGETQYLSAPGGEAYTVTMYGIGEGTFTLDIQERFGDTVSTTTSIANVPVTTDSVAMLSVSSSTQLSDLQVDIEGDGIFEQQIPVTRGEVVVMPDAEQQEAIQKNKSRSSRKEVRDTDVSTSTKEAITLPVTEAAHISGEVLGVDAPTQSENIVPEIKKEQHWWLLLLPTTLLIALLTTYLRAARRGRRRVH